MTSWTCPQVYDELDQHIYSYLPVVTVTSILFFVNLLVILVKVITIGIRCFCTWHAGKSPNASTEFNIFMVGQELVKTFTFASFQINVFEIKALLPKNAR